MAIVKCTDKDGNVGYQARWRGKTKYFACQKWGLKPALRMAKEWEKKARKNTPDLYIRRPNDKPLVKPRSNVPHLGIKWVDSKKGYSTPYIHTWLNETYGSRSFAISRRGLEETVNHVLKIRKQHRLESPNKFEAIKALRIQLKEQLCN